MGDHRNKLKREGQEYRAWCRSVDERLRERLQNGERPVCQCGRTTWGAGVEIRFVAQPNKPDAFYCPACEPVGLADHMRDMKRMYQEGFHERDDMKQLALFAEGKRRD